MEDISKSLEQLSLQAKSIQANYHFEITNEKQVKEYQLMVNSIQKQAPFKTMNKYDPKMFVYECKMLRIDFVSVMVFLDRYKNIYSRQLGRVFGWQDICNMVHKKFSNVATNWLQWYQTDFYHHKQMHRLTNLLEIYLEDKQQERMRSASGSMQIDSE